MIFCFISYKICRPRPRPHGLRRKYGPACDFIRYVIYVQYVRALRTPERDGNKWKRIASKGAAANDRRLLYVHDLLFDVFSRDRAPRVTCVGRRKIWGVDLNYVSPTYVDFVGKKTTWFHFFDLELNFYYIFAHVFFLDIGNFIFSFTNHN